MADAACLESEGTDCPPPLAEAAVTHYPWLRADASNMTSGPEATRGRPPDNERIGKDDNPEITALLRINMAATCKNWHVEAALWDEATAKADWMT